MEVKQVIVVRKDLNMRKGKIAAQVAHAAMKVFFDRMGPIEDGSPFTNVGVYKGKVTYHTTISEITEPMKRWMEGAFTKVVVGCNGKAELLELQAKADELGIPNALMVDNGWTEFHNTPTITCLAIGPDDVDVIDEVTKELPLI